MNAGGGHATCRRISLACWAATALASGAAATAAQADETCLSPYMQKITGHEDYVYVWTLGVEGMGDGSDKLVTIDVREGSPSAGKAIDIDSVGSRNEAHHGGFTDDRPQFWAAGPAASLSGWSRGLTWPSFSTQRERFGGCLNIGACVSGTEF